MLRSETVIQCELYLQPAIAFETMTQFAELDCIHIVDIHPRQSQLQSFTSNIIRCENLEKKLGYFEYEMQKDYDKVVIASPTTDPKPIHPSEMEMFENLIEKWEHDILDNSESIFNLRKDLTEAKEMIVVLKDIGPMLDASQADMDDILYKFQEKGVDALYHGKVYIMTGMIERSKSMQCQRMLWRISLGNIHYRQTDDDFGIENPETGKEVRKVAFMAACQGEELRSRMEKVCAAFKANIYQCSRVPEERIGLQYETKNRINDLENVLGKSKFYRCMALRSIGKQWQTWLIQVRKTKSIYHKMNFMTLDLPKNSLIGRCWIAEKDIERVQKTMNASTALMGVRAPSVITKVENTEEIPPTLHHTNKFTRAPQALINAFGDAKYKEINPGLFTIIGLPFFFGVMFSDMGHAIIIIVVALWMIIINEDELKERRRHEILDILYKGRYLLLLMGLWSFYAGFCFNQLFTKPINLSRTNSMYKNTYPEEVLAGKSSINMGTKSRVNKQYVWGTDPIWQTSNNKILMKNNQLMNLSLIIGTLHMAFGLILSVFNHRYFKNNYAIYLDFLPKFIYVLSLFGYNVVMIIYRWFAYYDGRKIDKYASHCAPRISTHIMARFFLDLEFYVKRECHTFEMFEFQLIIQLSLNLILILVFFYLLFGTPIYINMFNKKTKMNLKREMRSYRGRHMKECKLACNHPCGDLCEDACRKQEEKWQAIMDRHSTPFSVLLGNQFIYTIEFVLGSITHMTSYLRLWALAMAHYLISDAFWVIILRTIGIRSYKDGHWAMVFAFACFAILTFFVIITMQGLSCFLHALRLHWVEFMSKFYVDEGHSFKSFSFKNISSEMNIKSSDSKFKKLHSRFKKRKVEKDQSLVQE